MGSRRDGIGPLGFTLLMFSMTACLPLFFLGPIAYESGLSLGQALAGALIGNGVVALAMIVNSRYGLTTGKGFNMHAETVFGPLSRLVVALRGLVGGLWYGVEAYNGALALAMIVLALLAGREAALSHSLGLLPLLLAVYVGLATLVYARGMGAVSRAASIAGPILFLYLAALLVRTGSPSTGLPGPAPWLGAAFLGYVAIQASWWATVALNISDLSRHARSLTAVAIGVALGLVGGQLLGTYIGYMLAAASGSGLPQEIILNSETSTLLAVLGLFFAFLAPWTTDLTANIPALDDAVRLAYPRRSAIIAGLLGFVLAPWYLLDQAQEILGYVAAFAQAYGTLLGPFLGAMAAHSLLARRTGPGPAMLGSIAGLAASYAYAALTGTMQWLSLGPLGIPVPPGITILLGMAVGALATALASYAPLPLLLGDGQAGAAPRPVPVRSTREGETG